MAWTGLSLMDTSTPLPHLLFKYRKVQKTIKPTGIVSRFWGHHPPFSHWLLSVPPDLAIPLKLCLSPLPCLLHPLYNFSYFLTVNDPKIYIQQVLPSWAGIQIFLPLLDSSPYWSPADLTPLHCKISSFAFFFCPLPPPPVLRNSPSFSHLLRPETFMCSLTYVSSATSTEAVCLPPVCKVTQCLFYQDNQEIVVTLFCSDFGWNALLRPPPLYLFSQQQFVSISQPGRMCTLTWPMGREQVHHLH